MTTAFIQSAALAGFTGSRPVIPARSIEAQFTEAVGRMWASIERAALRIAERNADLADDLVQQALIGLWENGFERFAADDDPYAGRIARRRMKRALRTEWMQRNGLTLARVGPVAGALRQGRTGSTQPGGEQ